jgi:hypothetical protein
MSIAILMHKSYTADSYHLLLVTNEQQLLVVGCLSARDK